MSCIGCFILNGIVASSLQNFKTVNIFRKTSHSWLSPSLFKDKYNWQNRPGLQLHSDFRSLREIEPAPKLPVCKIRRFDDDQKAGKSRRSVQRSVKSGIHFHAVLQGRWVWPQFDWCKSIGHVWSWLESSQWRSSYGSCLEGWAKEAMLHLPVSSL